MLLQNCSAQERENSLGDVKQKRKEENNGFGKYGLYKLVISDLNEMRRWNELYALLTAV